MDSGQAGARSERFEAYLGDIAGVLGHARRVTAMQDYCTGLLLPVQRKSVEPIAALTEPGHASAKHQSLLHFVNAGEWSDAAVLDKVRALVLPQIEKHGAIRAWILDDTSFPKHGKHSVGVSHQYCGQLGKQANCQVAVSLSVANHHASLPIAYRLYLPESWASDLERRKKAGVPEDVEFLTKPKIARQQLEWAIAAGIPRAPVLIDSAYGGDLSLRRRIGELGLTYAVAVKGGTLVRKGAKTAKPIRADALARRLAKHSWSTVTWRQGTNAPLTSRFQRVRIRAAGEGTTIAQPEEWLLAEWPVGENEPTKFWLSTLPADIDLDAMVDTTMMRWRIERDYQELKQEVGLGHFEGRGWRGFHHHATMCIAAYAFLVSERSAFSPCSVRFGEFGKRPAVSRGERSG
jgi:SRSO17 transposase